MFEMMLERIIACDEKWIDYDRRSIVRFNNIEFTLMGLFEVNVLRQQAYNHRCIIGGNSAILIKSLLGRFPQKNESEVL